MLEYIVRPSLPSPMNEIYKIRYDAYIEEGLALPNARGIIKDSFDDLDTSTIFAVSNSNIIIGTARLVFDSDAGLPMADEGYAPYLNTLREQGCRLVEGTKFAFVPNSTTRRQIIDFVLYVMLFAFENGATDMLIMVTSHHENFYSRFFPFKILNRRFSSAYNKELSLLRWNYRKIDDHVRQSYVYKRYPERMESIYSCIAQSSIR